MPFAHLDLKLFTESEDEENFPPGHSYVAMQSWLPLFLIVDGEVERFDTEHAGYERDDFTSFLWGLWSRHENTIQTIHGDRIERRYGLFWILEFGPKIRYDGRVEGAF